MKSQKENREKREEKQSKETMTKNFQKLIKSIKFQFQEIQRTPGRLNVYNQNKNTYTHNTLSPHCHHCWKSKIKKKIWREPEKVNDTSHRGKKYIRIIANYDASAIIQARR